MAETQTLDAFGVRGFCSVRPPSGAYEDFCGLAGVADIDRLAVSETLGQELLLEHGETDLYGYSEAVGTDLLLEHGETDLYGYWDALGVDLILEHGETDSYTPAPKDYKSYALAGGDKTYALAGGAKTYDP